MDHELVHAGAPADGVRLGGLRRSIRAETGVRHNARLHDPVPDSFRGVDFFGGGYRLLVRPNRFRVPVDQAALPPLCGRDAVARRWKEQQRPMTRR